MSRQGGISVQCTSNYIYMKPDKLEAKLLLSSNLGNSNFYNVRAEHFARRQDLLFTSQGDHGETGYLS